jgi:TonB family protein
MSSRTRMSSSTSGALRLAEEYLARGDINEALSIYRVISEADRANPDIKRRLGELCALAETMNHHEQRDSADIVFPPTDQDVAARSPVLPARVGLVKRAESDGGKVAPSLPGSEATNDALLVGKLAAAEILFGFGRSDRATALLEELLAVNPDDPRIHAKLKDLSSRSGIPQGTTAAHRQSARTDEAIQEQASAHNGGSRVARTVSSRAASIGVRLQETRTNVKKLRRSRYLVAVIGLIAVTGTAGGYLLVRRTESNNIRPDTEIAQTEPAPVESPTTDSVIENQAAPGEDPGGQVERQTGRSVNQPDGSTSNSSSQRQVQSTSERQSTSAAPDGAQTSQKADLTKPTPPAVNAIGAVPATGGGSPNVAPGGLAADAPAAAPTPVPPPIVRRASAMGGGENLKRVAPVYPPAARAAHITGTVTVELAINEQGKVVSVRAISGPAMLTLAAESAARGFRYTPITVDGVAVKATRTVLFHFKE